MKQNSTNYITTFLFPHEESSFDQETRLFMRSRYILLGGQYYYIHTVTYLYVIEIDNKDNNLML